MTDELKALLSEQVSDVSLAPGQAARAVTGARRQQRRRAVTGAVLALALVGGGTAVVLAVGGDDTDALVPATPAFDNADLLVRDGDRVTGGGRIVQLPGQAPRLCGGLEGSDDPAYAPGQEPAPRACVAGGITLVGADMRDLYQRRAKDGAVEGEATVWGTYRAGVLTVDEQEAGPLLRPLPDDPDLASPPCDEPDGGWPSGDLDTEGLGAYDSATPGLIVMFPAARATPRLGSAVLVVLARDEQARLRLEDGLRPFAPGLCVLVAQHSASDVASAEADLDGSRRALGVSGGYTSLDRTWQQVVYRGVLVVDDAVLAVSDRHPAGLIRFDPVIRPDR